MLTITAREDSIGGKNYTSARITTKGKADFRYGRIETRARLPQSQGLWPAFWLLPTENKFGEWPKSGEVDVFELVGHKPNEVFGTIHTGLPWTFISGYYTLDSTQSFADTFNVFSIEWEPDVMRWFVNGELYHEISSDSISPWPPFQETFHLIFNVAVGGNLPGFTDETTMLPQIMEVDWVRVYSTPERIPILGKQPVIGQTGLTYHTYELEDANYSWTVPDGSTIVSGQGTNAIVVNWGCEADDVLLLLETDCDTVELIYPIDEFADISINGATEVVQNQEELIYSVPQVDSASYTWNVPTDATIITGQGTNKISVNWGCTGGKISVEGSGACTDFTDTLDIDLRNYFIQGFSFVPANGTGRVYSIEEIANATYFWQVPEDAIITSGQGTNEIEVDFGAMGGVISVDITNSCGTEQYTLEISIDPSNIYCDFDGKDLEWIGFSGSVVGKIENPFKDGINLSDHVGITRKDPGSVFWAGIFADLGGEMDLLDNPFLNMKVASEKSGTIKFKLEDQTGNADPFELDLDYTTPNEWRNLVWDFTGQPEGTFDRIALFFDWANTDTAIWLFDDVIGRAPLSSVSNIEATRIEIFPNPVSENITIDWKSAFQLGTAVDIEIINNKGISVHRQQVRINSAQTQIKSRQLSPGNYFIRLSGKSIQYVKAFVKIE